jgi:hypothetical protein
LVDLLNNVGEIEMKNTAANNQTTSRKLDLVRALELPSREAMLHRDPSVSKFWSENKQLLGDAWREWEEIEQEKLLNLDDSLLDSKLRNAVEEAWESPTKEIAVEKLWKEVSPGVFQCQFFDPERLDDLRKYLIDIQETNIPLRPPYGIALNRFGAMLDERSPGYLAAPAFQSFYNQLLDKYMRPIARLLFPEIIGYDTQTFGFSIQYQPDMDTSLQLHSDASAVTLNINLNLPEETYSGSEVDFYDPISGKANRLTFNPGTAMIHRGNVVHEAKPIKSGKRTNIVLWLYGDHMQVPSYKTPPDRSLSAQERWTVPSVTKDEFAPF